MPSSESAAAVAGDCAARSSARIDVAGGRSPRSAASLRLRQRRWRTACRAARAGARAGPAESQVQVAHRARGRSCPACAHSWRCSACASSARCSAASPDEWSCRPRLRRRLAVRAGDDAGDAGDRAARCASAGDVESVAVERHARRAQGARRRAGASAASAADERPRATRRRATVCRGARRAATRAGAAPRHVRIDLRRLDALLNLVGELVIVRGRLRAAAAQRRRSGARRGGRRGVAARRRRCRTEILASRHGAGGAGVRPLPAPRARRGARARQGRRLRRWRGRRSSSTARCSTRSASRWCTCCATRWTTASNCPRCGRRRGSRGPGG